MIYYQYDLNVKIGDSLALTTNPGGGRNSLYLYDVARSDTRRPTHSAAFTLPAKRTPPSLQPSLPLSSSLRRRDLNRHHDQNDNNDTDIDMDDRDENRIRTQFENSNETETGETPWYEINSAAFSPDSTLIALARTDNVVLIYDSRFLGRGESGSSAGGGSAYAGASTSASTSGRTPLLGVEHSFSSTSSVSISGGGGRNDGGGARAWACLRHPWRHAHSHARGGFGYGISGMQWVEGLGPHGGLGLVTGGADG